MSDFPNPLPRQQWLILLRTGIDAHAWDFVRQAADRYLHTIPHDLEVQCLQAEALLGLGDRGRAFQLASAVALADPEDAAAHAVRLRALPLTAPSETRTEIIGALAALGHPPTNATPPAWSIALQQAYTALQQHDLEAAQAALFPALPGNGHIPLLAVAHLRLVWAQNDWAATLHLARTYHQRWPDVLAFRLILAHQLAESGQETESVAMLHAVAAADPAGQVLRRLLGEHHPYWALWPKNLAAPLDIPLPAAVASALGRNRLPESKPSRSHSAPQAASTATKATEKPQPAQEAAAPAPRQASPAPSKAPAPAQPATSAAPSKRSARTTRGTGTPRPASTVSPAASHRSARAAERVLSQAARRLKMAHLVHTEGRFPVYVIFSTRSGLEKHYGQDTAKIILRHMHALAKAVGTAPDWEATVLLADDAASAHEHGIKPVTPDDPWALKKQLASLDVALGRKGSMIGALLIVGGPEVVPFHHLPNPLEDEDDIVPSDNPYGAIDENYLAPTWPVGRLPGSADGDATLLLGALRRMTAEHRNRQHAVAWYRRWWQALRAHLPFLRRHRLASLGYTAEVWEKAARAVFKEIGAPRTLLASPPLHTEALGVLPRTTLAYFNLHGLADAAPWYGQRDPTRALPGAPDYPVALRPEDLPPREHAPRVVFSEACYGAYLKDKTPNNAMCLRFLYAGSQAFVGSTVTAYGAVTTPLSAADLLGALFWQRLKLGLPAGEALRQAKYLYARQMHQRFGFLDGEDQKTLISFVLYGDPLYHPFGRQRLWGKGVLRPKEPLKAPLAEERATVSETLPPRMSKRIKAMVEAYLPGHEGIDMLLAEETVETAAKGQRGNKRVACKVAVVSKRIAVGGMTHRHFMRVAMGPHGKVLKVSVSR